MRVYSTSVATPENLPARISLAVRAGSQPFDLTGSAVLLEIWYTRGVDELVYSATESAPVIMVGETISVEIPADTVDYADLLIGYRYEYGMTIIHPALVEMRVQGDWTIKRRYGHNADTGHDWTVSVDDSSLTINIGGFGPQGETGETGAEGPAGPWSITVHQVTADTALTAEDGTAVIMAGIGTINVTLPLPAALYDSGSGNSNTLRLIRPEDDDQAGTVNILGDGPGLPDKLYPGESVEVQSDGSKLLIFG